MDEVGSALIAIALVLGAVFIPAAFISGISGQFFRQFAVTIAAATAISCLVSLTLSPALCALLLKPHRTRAGPRPLLLRPVHGFFAGFNWLFDRLSRGYGSLTRRLVRRVALALVVYAGLIVLTGWQFERAPTGFIPQQDQGYLITVVQLPPGASLAPHRRGGAPGRRDRARHAGRRPRRAVRRLRRRDLHQRAQRRRDLHAACALRRARRQGALGRPASWPSCRSRYGAIQEAFIIVIQPPPVRGIGTAGGFKMMVEDRRGRGPEALEAATGELVAAANQTPGLSRVFSLFNTRTPKIYADIDRVKAEMLGVTPEQVFEALEVYIGSTYVNDFNFLGRTFRVTAQADAPVPQGAARRRAR